MELIKEQALQTLELADRLNAHAEEQLGLIVIKLASPTDEQRTKYLLEVLESASPLPYLIKVLKLVLHESLETGEELEEVITGTLMNLKTLSLVIEKIADRVESV